MRIEAIFSYEPKDGFLFRLHPITKVLFMFFFSIVSFLFGLKSNLIFVIFVLILIVISKIPILNLLKSFKGIYFFLVLAMLGNMFSQPGKEIFQIGGLPVTQEGLETGILVALRLILLVFISISVSMTTSLNELSKAIESLLSPLKIFKINVAEIAFILSLTLRALMLLVTEVVELRKLYQAKGLIRKGMSLKEQIKLAYYLLVPMIVITMRRSEEMAFALSLRGYNPDRTRIILEERRVSKYDTYFAMGVFDIFFAICNVLLVIFAQVLL
ncbi:MAG: energy-coupling factor transporter transmembrane protein EcfT [Actinobacteria bacterium]|nr:energy-coupling factor transporter transmembrane protein EcfT [Actinomycetota bacterium]